MPTRATHTHVAGGGAPHLRPRTSRRRSRPGGHCSTSPRIWPACLNSAARRSDPSARGSTPRGKSTSPSSPRRARGASPAPSIPGRRCRWARCTRRLPRTRWTMIPHTRPDPWAPCRYRVRGLCRPPNLRNMYRHRQNQTVRPSFRKARV